MIGCDLHDATTVLKVAEGPGTSVRKGFATANRAGMIAWLKDFAAQRGATRIVFAYEASGQGFGLYDDLTEAGIECHVLAPTHLPHNAHSRKNKTDDKDAEMILDEVRAYVLAGRPLPSVWVPDHQTREDREPVRLRLQVAEQRTRIKNQIRNLAKRWQLAFPEWFSTSGEWSKRSLAWLDQVAAGETGELPEGVRTVLASLVELYRSLTVQIKTLDRAIDGLSKSPRYARMFRKLKTLSGVGTLTAMVFLTELGDLARFANRRQLAAYLGLAPSTFESGERNCPLAGTGPGAGRAGRPESLRSGSTEAGPPLPHRHRLGPDGVRPRRRRRGARGSSRQYHLSLETRHSRRLRTGVIELHQPPYHSEHRRRDRSASGTHRRKV
jgi:transposase